MYYDFKNTALLSHVSHVCSIVPVVKPYQCDTCDYSCNKAYILKKHQRQHSGERPYSCRQCPYHCTTLALLEQHMEAHESLTAVTCPHCLIVWGSPTALVLHKGKCRNHQMTAMQNDQHSTFSSGQSSSD